MGSFGVVVGDWFWGSFAGDIGFSLSGLLLDFQVI